MADITWYCTVFISLRQTVRLMIIEIYQFRREKEGEEIDVSQEYHLLVTTQSYAIFFSLVFLFNSFEPTLFKNVVNHLTALISGIIITLGLYDHLDFKGYFVRITLGFFAIIYILRITQ